ncbi:MAG TPA: DUF1365 domain-containing protein [Steroidobacteraceae bacterium]|nr:DUF1365 domain-containing protein [Steroidobacteraceae bacterium]
MHSALYTGRLRHRRFAPRPHAFTYAVHMLWLDLAELDRVFRGRWFWSTRRRALAWFRRADYLGDPSLPLDEAVRRRVADAGQPRPAGPIRMLAQLRNYGHCFNPVTFYYCYDAADTRVEAVVAEITNTPWGERHAYVLPAAASRSPGTALDFSFGKDFHVSPFMPMDIAYHWRFTAPGRRLAVHMENSRGGEPVFDATLTLSRREITGSALAGVLLRFPFSTLRVLAAIYWQALRLKLKGVPFHDHPRLARATVGDGRRQARLS